MPGRRDGIGMAHPSSIPKLNRSGFSGGFGLAVFGTIGFIMSGLERSGLPSGSYGYVSVPALIGISSTAMLFAPYGVYLSHRVPLRRLKRIFSLLLLCLAVNIVVGLI